MIRHLLFAFCLLIATPAFATSTPSAAAPVIDQKGADALKPRVADSLNAVAASFSQKGMLMKQSGDLMVEPAGTYYAVTTPLLTLDMPGGVTRTIGMVAINAIPTNDPDVFKVAVALPTPMVDMKDGRNVGSLDIGTQSMNGLWNMTALAFLQMDANYKNIRINDLTKNAQTQIPELTATLRLSPSGKFHSGPFEIAATGMSYKDPKKSWSAGTNRLRAMLHDLDLSATRDARQQAATGGAAGMQSAALALATSLLDRADILVDQQNLSWQNVTPQGGTTGGTVKTIVMKSALSKIRTGLADGTIEYTAEGFTSTDTTAVNFTPTHMNFRGNVEKLPLAAFVQAPGRDGIRNAINNAGTHIVLTDGVIDAPGYGLGVTGDLTASNASPYMGIGKFRVEMRGMDALTSYLATPTGAASLGLEHATNNLVPLLAVLQLAGHPGKDASGRAVSVYDVKITKDGAITMNGNDMTTVISTLGEAAQGAQPQGPLAPTVVAPPTKK